MSQTYEYGDYNRGGMLAFSFSMVITLAFFIYVAFIHQGVDLKEIPSEAGVEAEANPMAEAGEAGDKAAGVAPVEQGADDSEGVTPAEATNRDAADKPRSDHNSNPE